MAATRIPRLVSFAAAMLVAAGLVSAVARPASALDFGPSYGGHSDGSVFCDHFNHRIVFNYSARAQVQVVAGSGLYDDIAPASHNQVNVTPEWIEVVAYVKPASGGSWAFVGRNRILLDTVNSATVLHASLPATVGAYWKAGFHVRVAYPGGNWSNWFWEPATPSMSYSGSVSAQYGYCFT